uniref:SCP domain-containing protein n=1 Tax=Trichobilharzia regenti TaxID=157069 RepID=A0AA85IVW4_TRIRE|nr:unnamed protein product [Trichobilharzia regenti]
MIINALKFSLLFVLLSTLFTTTLCRRKELPKDLKEIFKLHKYYRNSILLCQVPGQPPAKDLENIRWSKRLARNAQRLADKCDIKAEFFNEKLLDHYESVGQNIAEADSVKSGMEKWFRESDHYDYKTDKCTKRCANYKQMVWAKTRHVGCGIKQCKGKLMLVCNYAPASDDKGRPYEEGSKEQCVPLK